MSNNIYVFSSKNYAPSEKYGWKLIKKDIQGSGYENGMSLVLGNTRPSNQWCVTKSKRYRKCDYSDKSNYFDVDGFSQHSHRNSLWCKKGENHMHSECRHSTIINYLTNDNTYGVCLTIYEDITMDCFYIKGGQGCCHNNHHARLSQGEVVALSSTVSIEKKNKYMISWVLEQVQVFQTGWSVVEL